VTKIQEELAISKAYKLLPVNNGSYFSYFSDGYKSRDEEIKKLKENSDWLIKCPHCESMFNKIYDYCPWCGNKVVKDGTP
jgi:hypothetical protein